MLRGPAPSIARLARLAHLGALASALAACRSPSAARDIDAPDPSGSVDADVPDTSPPAIDAPDIDAPIDARVDAGPDGPPGVWDLQFVGSQMTRYLVTATDIPEGDCAMIEGCVGGTGTRQLLRFRTVTANRGTGDLFVGTPPPPEMSDDTFEWSPCHKHHHLKGYAKYELLDEDGVVLTGRKQSFCVSDNKQVDQGVPFPQFQCTYQGLSRGWADVYDLDVPCQWLDVTTLAPGAYTLRITVNPDNGMHEADTSNNVFTLPVRI